VQQELVAEQFLGECVLPRHQRGPVGLEVLAVLDHVVGLEDLSQPGPDLPGVQVLAVTVVGGC